MMTHDAPTDDADIARALTALRWMQEHENCPACGRPADYEGELIPRISEVFTIYCRQCETVVLTLRPTTPAA